MKKIIVLIIALFTQVSFAEPQPGTFAAQQDEREAIVISENLKLTPKIEHEEDKQIPFSIDANYPQLTGKTLSPAAQQFNKVVSEMTHKEIEQFKKYVKVDMPHMNTLPDELKNNTLHIDYDVDFIKPGDQAIISLRLSIEGFQAGRAHPYHNHRVLNFDLGTGKVLSLNDLFKPRSNYLNLLSRFSVKKLNTKLQDKFMIAEGTKPIEKNFQNWNLEPDGIVITFDEYQVAPYSYGPQEVEIPFETLKAFMSKNIG